MRGRRSLEKARLYCVLDTQVENYDRLFTVAKNAVAGGVDIVQLRDKNGSAYDILNFIRRLRSVIKKRALLIVNDRVDLALASGSDGVHLGQEDIPVDLARELAGRSMIIGASCQTLGHALKAQEKGADYIGFGSVFKTRTKPCRRPMDLPLLKKVLQKVHIPVFPIGGITSKNIETIRGCGVDRIAVTRAICSAKDPRKAARDLKSRLFARG